MSKDIEGKLYDFTYLLKEWIDRYKPLGAPRHKHLAQARTDENKL